MNKEVRDMGSSEWKGPEVGKRVVCLRKRKSPVWLGEQGGRWGQTLQF